MSVEAAHVNSGGKAPAISSPVGASNVRRWLWGVVATGLVAAAVAAAIAATSEARLLSKGRRLLDERQWDGAIAVAHELQRRGYLVLRFLADDVIRRIELVRDRILEALNPVTQGGSP